MAEGCWKVGYPDRQSADRQMHRMRRSPRARDGGRRLMTYACRWCRQWHIGNNHKGDTRRKFRP